MDQIRRDKTSKFWWRGAEPVTSDSTSYRAMHAADADANDQAAEIRHWPSPSSKAPPASEIAPVVPDLGALRPMRDETTPEREVPLASAAPSANAAPAPPPPVKPRTFHPAAGDRIAASSRRRLPAISPSGAVLAAALAGAVIFAGVTGFGRHVRYARPLPEQIDRLLIAAGFGINEVSLSGQKHTLDGEIFKVLATRHRSLAGFDVAAARKRLEDLPWIKTATLVRILPDKLRVDIQERKPSALWLNDGRKTLIDDTGRVLGHLGSFAPPDLMQISGKGAPEAAPELQRALGTHPQLKQRLKLARRVSERRWDLEFGNGLQIKLPDRALAESLARLSSLLAANASLDSPNRIVDLRLAEVVATRPREPSTTTPDATASRADAAQRL